MAFVTLCLVPSGSLCGWIAYRATPIYSWRACRSWEHTLHQRTGVLVTIQRASQPLKKKTLLEQITLTDPDSGLLLSRVRAIEIAETDHGLVALVSQPEIEPQQLRRFGELLHANVIRGPQPTMRTQLVLGDVTLHSDRGAVTYSNVTCLVEADDSASTYVTIDFLLAGGTAAGTSQLRITRRRGRAPLATVWQLRTGSSPLPCRLLADYLPIARRLGSHCTFQGTAWIEQRETDWDGEVTGRFAGADLARLLEPFPHKLSGTAEILLSHSRFEEGRVTELAGSLRGGSGVVSRSLIDAASNSLHLASHLDEAEQTRTLLAYQQLACGFRIDDTGLLLSGQCECGTPDVVLADPDGKPLLTSSADVLPSVAIVRALVPQSNVQVPATRATEVLLRALPLPAIDPPAAYNSEQPYAPLRLRR